VKSPRSDNGGEYISNEFKEFCRKEGIQRELIAPHNPQQNGFMERKNGTIVGAE
jgi:putative transposase